MNRTVDYIDTTGREFKFHANMCKPYPIGDRFFTFYAQDTRSAYATQSSLQAIVNDPNDSRFDIAKTQVQGILNRGGFKPIKPNEIPADAPLL